MKVFLVFLLGAFVLFWGLYKPNVDKISIPEITPTFVPTGVKKADFQPPLDRISERVTKKTFGMYITPQNSPMQPEKFKGYHTGVDFEVFPDEENKTIPVSAICEGKLLVKKYASGYGGVVVQSCKFKQNEITVIYGHLLLSSVIKKAGSNLTMGETIGVLGAKSQETDGERKHLHLGVHLGTAINILGYVSNKAQLKDWEDPLQLFSP